MYNPIFDFDEISCLYWQSIYRSLLGYIVPYDVPSSAIISFVSDGEIVLIKRKNTNFRSLPGGEITWGETIRKNVRRKLATETGLELVKIKHTAGLYFPSDNSQIRSLTVYFQEIYPFLNGIGLLFLAVTGISIAIFPFIYILLKVILYKKNV